jgi:hypothetical protein
MVDKRYLLKGLTKVDKRKGKTITLELNKEMGNTTGSCILESLGYNYLDNIDNIAIYENSGKLYRFISMEHYNGYVYSITIKEVF